MVETLQHSGIFRNPHSIHFDQYPYDRIPGTSDAPEPIRTDGLRWHLEDGTIDLKMERFHVVHAGLPLELVRFTLTIKGAVVRIDRLQQQPAENGRPGSRQLTLQTAKGNLVLHLLPTDHFSTYVDSADWYERHTLMPVHRP